MISDDLYNILINNDTGFKQLLNSNSISQINWMDRNFTGN